jgi:hypothetical protein
MPSTEPWDERVEVRPDEPDLLAVDMHQGAGLRGPSGMPDLFVLLGLYSDAGAAHPDDQVAVVARCAYPQRPHPQPVRGRPQSLRTAAVAGRGWGIHPLGLAQISPYQTEHVNRFGAYSPHETGLTPEDYETRIDVDISVLEADQVPAARRRGAADSAW